MLLFSVKNGALKLSLNFNLSKNIQARYIQSNGKMFFQSKQSQSITIQNQLHMSQAVKVMVRCRPINQKELDRGCKNVVEVDTPNKQINLLREDSREQPKSFSFDYVFGSDCAQSLIYEQSAFSLVDNVLDGYNGTIFAYGQTGCGKTHTMMGSNQSEESKGIIPRTFSQIMTLTKNDTSKTHLIRCSFIQIYNEEIHDLLGKDVKARMELKECPDKGVFVKDLLQLEVDNIEKMEQYMELGFKSRAVRATNMNAESSRSHSIFTIYIDSQQSDDKGNEKYKASKLNLVDLAGSERASKTGATGDGMKQATKINLSLSALGNVISALVDGKTHHIPYRDSKLTRLLQDSLGGNTKTIMIAAVSPANYNYDETLSTLRYASRAKFIQNKPKINEDPKDALLREYMEEIKNLKMMLEGKAPMMPIAYNTGSAHNLAGSDHVIHERIVVAGGSNNMLEEELKSKENQLRNQQQEKMLLQQKLQNLEKHFETKGLNNSDEKELERIKKLKQKLKSQKKKEEQYIKQKQRRQEELLSIQKNYKSLNEQVDQMRLRFKQIKGKYVANLQELTDIRNQHEDQKQQMLDTIREQEKQVKKYKSILNILMSHDQIQYIVNHSEWNEDSKQWKIPNFTYKEKNMGLPKITPNTCIGMYNKDSQEQQRQKQKKQIAFKNSMRTEQKTVSSPGFKVNNILRNARQNSESLGNMNSNKHLSQNIKTQLNLSPLAPLQNEKERFMDMTTEKRRKMDRLDPIRNF